jgi:DtxR family Mn-dependent transcriptional regulator
MQDYLKAMLSLSEAASEIRVTDIAARLNIAKATVAQGINHLKKHGLVTQDKYGPIELTESGLRVAEEVRWRHQQLENFLISVLGVEPKIAATDAGLMEHAVSRHTMNRLMAFLESHGAAPEAGTAAKKAAGAEILIRTLNDLENGERARVVRIASDSRLRSRLLDMGLTPGAEVQVKGRAPLWRPGGDSRPGLPPDTEERRAKKIYVEAAQKQ